MTYFPDAHFIERLERIHSQVSKIVIVDNTGDADHSAPLKQLDSTDIEIIRNKENLGIGAALNQGLALAVELGYSWAITFDQDSWVHPDLVQTLIRIHEQHPRPELVGIIGCNFEDENTGAFLREYKINGPLFAEAESVITSGSLMPLAIFSSVGPFQSELFIDFVDHEYCLRLRKLGYRVVMALAPLMVHALGAATSFVFDTGVRKFSVIMTNRSPLRRYYITRNGLLVAKKYFTVAPRWILKSVASILAFSLLKIPFEKTARRKKFCATLYGAFDALRSKTGKAQARWLEE